jgi:hypothetical protein
MPESRRELYRIVYPLAERPVFEAGRFLLEVIDVSEKGMRFEMGPRRLPEVGTELGGTIQFRSGDAVEVQGEVIRAREGVVVLALDPPLPYSQILAEQRYLRGKGYTLRD